MNKKEVKQLTKGCTVLVKAKVSSVHETKAYVSHGCITHPLPFSEIYSVPTQPKYDPCREFQPGDKVRMVMRDDRYPYCYKMREHIVPTDTICTIAKRENCGFVEVEYNNGYNPIVHFSFLELVTPVEELKPYSVVELSNGDYAVYKGDERLCVFRDGELVTQVEEIKPYSVHETDYLYRVMQSVDGGEQVVCEYRKNTHPHAKERAEVERDSLNAEWRKEHS